MRTQPTRHDLTDLFPQRGISVRPPRSVEGGTLGVIVLFAVFLIGLLGGLGPSLLDDMRLRGESVATADPRLGEVHCRSWIGVFRFCSITIEGNGTRTLRYAYFGTAHELPRTVVSSANDTTLIGTDLGVAKVASRITVLALLAGAMMCCLGIAAGILRRGMAARRTFARAREQRLVPVIVEMERNNRLPPRRRLWVYCYDDGGRRERALAEWPSAWRPLFTSKDESRALALRGANGLAPMLLDAGLNGVDLTEAEKAAFHERFRALFGDPEERADTV